MEVWLSLCSEQKYLNKSVLFRFLLLTLTSPLINTGASTCLKVSSSRHSDSFESSSKNLLSFPRVGRYTAMWILSGQYGGSNISGRKEEENTGWIEIYGSCSIFHKDMVPPFAFDFVRGSSGSYLSSELREHLYSP